jgi:hypothetical protein
MYSLSGTFEVGAKIADQQLRNGGGDVDKLIKDCGKVLPNDSPDGKTFILDHWYLSHVFAAFGLLIELQYAYSFMQGHVKVEDGHGNILAEHTFSGNKPQNPQG